MNNRIEELAKQSGVTGYFAASTEYAMPLPLLPELKKFAEMIIGECTSLFGGSQEIKTVGLVSHNEVVNKLMSILELDNEYY